MSHRLVERIHIMIKNRINRLGWYARNPLEVYKKLKNIGFYSQKGQDRWVIKDVFRGKRGCFFLDLAAANGIHLSNTYYLERKFGWNGICVEANEYFFKQLKKNRKCICDSSCIDEKKGKVRFINNAEIGGIVDEDTDNSLKLRKQLLEKHKDKITWKETITLKDLLIKYNAPKIIDYFSFDVEGAEERILKQFPFNEYTFLTMTIERPTTMLNKILLENGYIFIRKSNICNDFDSFYVHRSIEELDSIRKEPFSETPRKCS